MKASAIATSTNDSLFPISNPMEGKYPTISLLPLKALALELQRPAVVGNSPRQVVRHPARNPRLNFQRHRDLAVR